MKKGITSSSTVKQRKNYTFVVHVYITKACLNCTFFSCSVGLLKKNHLKICIFNQHYLINVKYTLKNTYKNQIKKIIEQKSQKKSFFYDGQPNNISLIRHSFNHNCFILFSVFWCNYWLICKNINSNFSFRHSRGVYCRTLIDL